MSEFHVEVVQVGPIVKHPKADFLGITMVRDYRVIVRLGDFQEGALAAYIPVDSVVPENDARFAFLEGHTRIKAKRLRGEFSMGLLMPLPAGTYAAGQDVADLFGVKKYEPPLEFGIGGESERCHFHFPTYTDLQAYRRWPNVLPEGTEVVITEKLHGTSGRFVNHDGRLWVGGHSQVKRDGPKSVFWSAAREFGIEEFLSRHPDLVLYGEVYGVQKGMRYGCSKDKAGLRIFDAMELKSMRYLDYDEFSALLPGAMRVPFLFRGPWKKELLALAEGPSELYPEHVREGIVIRPAHERTAEFGLSMERLILKYHGEGFLLK